MKEITNPPALVAKAEVETCAAISRLAEQVRPEYETAQKLRAKSNAIGIEIGRMIVEACRDPEIEARLKVMNSKSAKPHGGTDTRAHSWVADELARTVMGYNPEYLRQCAREYLGALKAHCEQTRAKPPEYVAGGILKIEQAQLPVLKPGPPLNKPPTSPRMDAMFTLDDAAEQENKTATQRAREAAAKVQRSLGELDRAAWKEFFNAIGPMADANGFAILPKAKGGNFK